MIKALEIAVVLSAVDRMSSVFNNAVNVSSAKLKGFQEQYQKDMKTGTIMTAAGAAILAGMAPAIQAYADLEDSSERLASVMLKDGSVLSSNFEKVNNIAIELGNRLPGTTADFQMMFTQLIRGGVTEQSILKGVGKAAAYLAVALKLPYEEAARVAAKLKEATGIADGEMLQFMDTIARVNQLGVDSSEMQYAFARSAGALKLLNIQGLDASKSIASIYAQLIKVGASGETVGTGMTSVFNSMLDANKMAKFNKAAASMGVSFEFVDQKTGQFKGVEHMIAQFERLREFNPQERANLVRALLGPGQDASFMNTLINNGVKGFNDMQKRMAEQATLDAKVNRQLVTLKNVYEAATGTFTNMLAMFGKALGPELKAMINLFADFTVVVMRFAEAHPRLMKFIGLFVGIGGALIILVGIFFLVKAAILSLTVVMMANPFILIAVAIVAVAALIITYWDEIVMFFKWVWDKIKAAFLAVWPVIKYVPILFLADLIIKNWGTIVGFFSAMWNKIVSIFKGPVKFLLSLPGIFFRAGINIITSLWNGIKSLASKPIEAIKAITQKMRDFLPFSPAKEGAFRDLHKVKIIETIAGAMKPAPMVRAMATATSAAAGYSGRSGGGFSGGSGGGVTISYAPQLNFYGATTEGTKDAFLSELKKHKDDIMRMIDDAVSRRETRRF